MDKTKERGQQPQHGRDQGSQISAKRRNASEQGGKSSSMHGVSHSEGKHAKK